MQVVTDPDNYQASEIVQKSSKSGIFSNKRLLVIKNGFLYYFTNVPKNYKTHVPNILATLKELPKSSIEIKAIQQIKMQSSNSTNLIIKFYEKDMIEREDIRKSINDKNYKYSKKEGEQLEEWKFTYSKVLNCRLWYTALLKLKAYFSKQEDKIQQFFNNFDPVKRNSHMPSTVSKDLAPTGQKNYRASQIMSQFKKQDERKQQQKTPTITLEPTSPKKNAPKDEPQLMPTSSEHKLQTINQDEEIANKKIEDDYRQQIQEQVRLEEKRKNEKIIESIKSELESKNEKIKILEEAIKATDKLRKKQEEARQKQRQKQKQRQLEMEKQIQRQREKQKQLREEEKKRQKFIQGQQYKQKRSSQQLITPVSLNLEMPRRTVELNEFSVQTDGSEEQDNEQSKISRKRNNESYISGLASTQRDTFNIFRNAGSLSFELDTKDTGYQNYDYYTEVESVQSPQIKFQDRIKKQIKLINYVNKMKGVALDSFREYIDSNNPTKSICFAGTLFQFQIVCEHGKIININGIQKLVYSNKEHQRLKREFKMYNHLQDLFIQLTEKRKRFPLRVPLCFHFQYRGYSGLLKYLPYLKPIQNEDESERAMKLLSKLVHEQNTQNYELHQIANRINTLYMVTARNTYKITKQNSTLQLQAKYLYGPKSLHIYRSRLISSNSNKIEEEIQKLQKQKHPESKKKLMGFNNAFLCRALKKLYRSTQPLSFDPLTNTKNTDFFIGFLSSPSQICSLVSDAETPVINGLFVSYFQYFFGLQVPSDFNINNINLQEAQFNYESISRSFSLNSLYPHKLLKNLQTYISSEKYDIVETAFLILSQLDIQNYNIELYKIKYQLKQFRKLSTQDIDQMIKSLAEIRKSVDRHNTIWMETYMLTIQCQTLGRKYQECLATIYEALEYINYMFGEQESGGHTEDYLCLLVAETLAKMGSHGDSMNVYRKLLANKNCTLTQQEICLSIAEIYCNFGQVDPSSLIQFLLFLIKGQNLSSSRVKQPQLTIWQAKIKKLIGLLYERLSNYDFCIKYLEESLAYYEANGIKNEEEVNDIVEICLSLFSNYQKMTDKSIIFAKLILLVEVNSKNEKFAVHIVRMVRGFVTACFCHLLVGLTQEKRQVLAQVLQELRDGEQIIPQFVQAIAYQDLQKVIGKLAQRTQLGPKQARVVELLDLGEIQTFLLTSQ